MQKRKRDVQRAKYYRAEAEMSSFGRRLETVDECQSVVDRIQRSEVWAALLGRRGIAEAPWVEVRDGRGSVYPCSEKRFSEWLLRLPRAARGEIVILRQMADFATPAPCAFHGPEFVTALLELVDEFLGSEAGNALRRALKKHRVHRGGNAQFRSSGPTRIGPRPDPSPGQPRSTRRRTGRRAFRQPRDSQRSRVYRAEQRVWGSTGRVFDTVDEMHVYVRAVERSPVWESLNRRNGSGPHRKVHVGDGRGAGYARAIARDWRIEVPGSLRNEWVVLHELSHLVTPERYAGHGPEFTRNFLTLVEWVMGENAAESLRNSFERGRVAVAAPVSTAEKAA